MENLEALKVVELRNILKQLKLSVVGNKSELVARLNSFYQNNNSDVSDNSSHISNGSNNNNVPSPSTSPNVSTAINGHIVLVLCEKLQSLPWDCLPSLKSQHFSRFPALSLLLSAGSEVYLKNSRDPLSSDPSLPNEMCGTAKRNKPPKLDVWKCWFSLDPDGTLPQTRATMHQFLQPYASRWGGEE